MKIVDITYPVKNASVDVSITEIQCSTFGPKSKLRLTATCADDTGSIRLVLFDRAADAAQKVLRAGKSFVISGVFASAVQRQFWTVNDWELKADTTFRVQPLEYHVAPTDRVTIQSFDTLEHACDSRAAVNGKVSLVQVTITQLLSIDVHRTCSFCHKTTCACAGRSDKVRFHGKVEVSDATKAVTVSVFELFERILDMSPEKYEELQHNDGSTAWNWAKEKLCGASFAGKLVAKDRGFILSIVGNMKRDRSTSAPGTEITKTSQSPEITVPKLAVPQLDDYATDDEVPEEKRRAVQK